MQLKPRRRLLRTRLVILVMAVSALCFSGRLLGHGSQDQETRAETFLSQADDLYAAGNYEKAIDSYLKASQTAKKKTNLSRAYMGLSLCCFYLNETENAKKYILQVLKLDPSKEVSSLFYPQTYVDLFEQVRRDNAEEIARAKVEEPAEDQLKEQPQKARLQTPALEGMTPEAEKAGRWEVEVHYSGWTIDPAKSLFQDEVTEKAAKEIRDHVTDQLNSRGANVLPTSSGHTLSLGSNGSNYGFEVRYYPLGKRGSMSLGFSLEKTRIRINVQGPVTQNYLGGPKAVVVSEGTVETNPLTGNVSFRWDVFPSWRVTPYFAFGVGFGRLDGNFTYVYSGTFTRGNSQTSVDGEGSKTFDELREEGEIQLDLILILQTSVGVKGEVYKGVFVKGEVGFWDGIIFRGGVGYRF
jgi:hypothetical protein